MSRELVHVWCNGSERAIALCGADISDDRRATRWDRDCKRCRQLEGTSICPMGPSDDRPGSLCPYNCHDRSSRMSRFKQWRMMRAYRKIYPDSDDPFGGYSEKTTEQCIAEAEMWDRFGYPETAVVLRTAARNAT